MSATGHKASQQKEGDTLTALREAEPAAGRGRAEQVRTLFSEIAPRYDLLNHLLSLNVDRRWRRRAIRELGWEAAPEGAYLDLCTGTFDLAVELAARRGFEGTVLASDFALPMLARGMRKIHDRPVLPVCGDTQRLPFADRTFAGVTVGFGVRNLSDPASGFREACRVLEPGGRLVVLEFSVPPGRLMRGAYLLYFNHILPRAGRLISGHPWAYSYLPKSVEGFPGPLRLAELIREAGFTRVDWFRLTGGIAAIHVGVKG